MINYKTYDYFGNRPEVVQIFEDLEELLDFCRFELLPYDPTVLYNRNSRLWRAFSKYRREKLGLPPEPEYHPVYRRRK